MLKSKSSLAALLAIASMAGLSVSERSANGQSLAPRGYKTKPTVRRVNTRMTQEQQEWNKQVEAKRSEKEKFKNALNQYRRTKLNGE